MINLRPQDALHRSQLNRLLVEIIDNPVLSQSLALKGGTCAAMLGFLDRFSVDLDFDLITETDQRTLRAQFHQIFTNLNFTISKEFTDVIFFQLKYSTNPGLRNTLKLSINTLQIKANQYQVQYFSEIDRLANSQTIETMFANKLVAPTDRFHLHNSIAGRDIYDIHHFFTNGYNFNSAVILERTGKPAKVYLNELASFIKKHITQTMIDEDLNSLLPSPDFQQIRRILLPETISLLTHHSSASS
jgi:predicted nucleotidyltransferase component of viral defense system